MSVLKKIQNQRELFVQVLQTISNPTACKVALKAAADSTTMFGSWPERNLMKVLESRTLIQRLIYCAVRQPQYKASSASTLQRLVSGHGYSPAHNSKRSSCYINLQTSTFHSVHSSQGDHD